MELALALKHWRNSGLNGLLRLMGLLLLAGCQAFSGDSAATIDADLTMYAAESEAILAAATAERSMALETVVAASTRVAELSAVNAALGATLRANYTGTPEVRAVVVSVEDMGSSLDDGMMDEEVQSVVVEAEMRVSNLATAARLDPNSGCSSGEVRQFSSAAERIYVTARVTALRADTIFRVAWLFEDELVYEVDWQADYSKSFECVWFYATPADFAFAPGDYTATMFVDGLDLGSTTFAILAN